jgi:hypothetical protein
VWLRKAPCSVLHLTAAVGLAAVVLVLVVNQSAAEARRVRIGFFVTSISAIHPADGSFQIQGFVWFIDPAAAFDPERDLEVVARSESVRTIERLKMPDGAGYTGVILDAVIDKTFDLRRYPFDRQELEILLESTNDISQIVFVPDLKDSRIADFVRLPGWHAESLTLRSAPASYASGFGHRPPDVAFSRVAVSVGVGRDRSVLLIDSFSGYMVALLITSLVFAIPHTEFGTRVGMTTGSIFAAVFNLYRLQDAIGFDASFGLVDQVSLLTFSAILWTLALSLLTHRTQPRGRVQAILVDQRFGAGVILLHFVLIAVAFAYALY